MLAWVGARKNRTHRGGASTLAARYDQCVRWVNKRERDDEEACEDEELRTAVRPKTEPVLQSSKPAGTSLDVLDLHVLCHLMECERVSSREKDEDDEATAEPAARRRASLASRSPLHVKKRVRDGGDGGDDMELALEGLALSPSPPSPFAATRDRPHTASSPYITPERLRTPRRTFTLPPSPPRKKRNTAELAPSLAPLASSPGRSWTTLGLDKVSPIFDARRTTPKACRSLDFSLPALSEVDPAGGGTQLSSEGDGSFDGKDAIDVVMTHKYGRPEDVMDVDDTAADAADAEGAEGAEGADTAVHDDDEDAENRFPSLVDVDAQPAGAGRSARVDRSALMEVMSAFEGGPWRAKFVRIEEEIFVI